MDPCRRQFWFELDFWLWNQKFGKGWDYYSNGHIYVLSLIWNYLIFVLNYILKVRHSFENCIAWKSELFLVVQASLKPTISVSLCMCVCLCVPISLQKTIYQPNEVRFSWNLQDSFIVVCQDDLGHQRWPNPQRLQSGTFSVLQVWLLGWEVLESLKHF